ncbi:WD40/YVTN/BNR-like repeat-containing protein [Cycloclasticus pugetii]|uniref:WD40/YVTN/BNR-like repeat-containing protein n=1 Tax=Cycloclasticus pugetii TaxID=34068 RepID=UPI003A8E0D4A
MMLRVILCLSLLMGGCAFAETVARPALELPLSTKAIFLDLEVHDEKVFAVGERGIILSSSDSGTSWSQIKSPVDVTLTGISFSSETDGWIVGHESTILHTTNAGETWTINRYKPEEERFYMSVHYVSPQLGYVLATDGELWVTEDAGKSWKMTLLSVEDWYQNHLFAIEKIAEGSLVVAERGGVFYSKDSLTDWQIVPSPYEGSFFGVNKLAKQFVTFGMSGNLYLVDSDSLEWEKIDTETDQFLLDSAASSNAKNLLVVGRGGIILVLNESGQLVKKIENKSRVDYTSVAIQGDNAYLSSMSGGIERISISELMESGKGSE